MSAAADHREWLTMHEAAEALGVTTRTIRRMIRIGVLRGGRHARQGTDSPRRLERGRSLAPPRVRRVTRRRRLIPACSGDRDQVRAVERLLQLAAAAGGLQLVRRGWLD
jgi:excisionase family DNA binding protein